VSEALTRRAARGALSRGAGEGLKGAYIKAPLSHGGRGGNQPLPFPPPLAGEG
jgi:hypothetical protein